MRHLRKQKQKGFTLIELLVVVAIIGMISSVILYSMTAARRNGRDAKRMQDVKQMNTAIQLFIAANGRAPILGSCGVANPSAGCLFHDYSNAWTTLQTELTGIVTRLPKDPCGASCPGASSSNYFTYSYAAPGFIKDWCNAVSCTQPVNDQRYWVYAQNLESTLNAFGAGDAFAQPSF